MFVLPNSYFFLMYILHIILLLAKRVMQGELLINKNCSKLFVVLHITHIHYNISSIMCIYNASYNIHTIM